MNSVWPPEQLSLLSTHPSLVLSAGEGGHPGVEIGMVVVKGELHVRAQRGTSSLWYRAAQEHGRGHIRMAGADVEVLLETAPDTQIDAVDTEYRSKYGAAAALLTTEIAHPATIRIRPASPGLPRHPSHQEEIMRAETTPSHRAIENLIARYAELVDDGDFAGLGSLLADATFVGSGEPVRGGDAIKKMFEDTLIVYADGTPRTQHVVTNIAVQVEDSEDKAVARSYVTVLQSLPDLPLQPIAAGRYHDRFELRDGRWRFVERKVVINHVGDVTRHLRRR